MLVATAGNRRMERENGRGRVPLPRCPKQQPRDHTTAPTFYLLQSKLVLSPCHASYSNHSINTSSLQTTLCSRQSCPHFYSRPHSPLPFYLRIRVIWLPRCMPRHSSRGLRAGMKKPRPHKLHGASTSPFPLSSRGLFPISSLLFCSACLSLLNVRRVLDCRSSALFPA